MHMQRLILFMLLLLAGALSGCGVTKVVTVPVKATTAAVGGTAKIIGGTADVID